MSFLPVFRKSARCALAALYFLGQTLLAGHFHVARPCGARVASIRSAEADLGAVLDRDCALCAFAAHSRAAGATAAPRSTPLVPFSVLIRPLADGPMARGPRAAPARGPPSSRSAVSNVG